MASCSTKRHRGCATLWPLLGRLANPLFLLTWEFPIFTLQHMPDSYALTWMYMHSLLVLNFALEVTNTTYSDSLTLPYCTLKQNEPVFISTASANIQQHSKQKQWRLMFRALPITTNGTPPKNMAPLLATRAYHQSLLWAKATYYRYIQVWWQDRATLCHSGWMPGIEQATTCQPRVKTWSVEFLPGPYALQVERRPYREGRDSKIRDFLLQS